jgi:hypothetical protein
VFKCSLVSDLDENPYKIMQKHRQIIVNRRGKCLMLFIVISFVSEISLNLTLTWKLMGKVLIYVEYRMDWWIEFYFENCMLNKWNNKKPLVMSGLNS